MRDLSLNAAAVVIEPLAKASKLVRKRPEAPSDWQVKTLERRRQGAVFMASIGVLLVLHRRASYDSWTIMAVESAVCLLCVLAARMMVKPRRSARAVSASNPWAASLACLAVAVPWIVNPISKQLGHGNGMELVMLASLAWGAVALVVLANVSRTISLSVVCSGFLTLFVTFIADSTSAVWFSATWGIACLWWLTNNHWEQVETTAAVGVQPARMPRAVMTLVGCAVFSVGALAVSNRVPILRKLSAEVMPTSGGTSAKDSAARRGVGNGDALVAAKKHATSFGAVETDMFLDSEKPSLFDVFSDEFGEPRKNERVERAQALSPQEIQNQEGNVTEANRAASSPEFSVERELPAEHKPTDNLVAESLMFWQGEPGATLAVQRFNFFDGTSWSNADPDALAATSVKPPSDELPSTVIDDQTWFSVAGRSVQNSISPFIDALPEALKFTRYRSPLIPTRTGMQLWCIDQIDRSDFFEVTADDCLLMPGREHVPDYTVVRMINSRIDLERLESLTRNCSPGKSHQGVSDECKSLINELAHQFGGGQPRGWQQVQAVVDGLRNRFELDRLAMEKEPVHSELVQFVGQRRGPDYMFATTAALMLEHLGYQTRFVTGFYANPKHYMAHEGEIAILPRDAHAWLEINVGHGYWIPLEPSPGYRQPRYSASWFYHAYQLRWKFLQSAMAGLLVFSMSYWLRGWLVELLSRCVWPVAAMVSDRRRIAWLTWLLDLRCHIAGVPRSCSTMPRMHLRQISPIVSSDLRGSIAQYFDSADRLWFMRTEHTRHEQTNNLPTHRLSISERSAIAQVWRGLTISLLRHISCSKP